MPSNRFAVVIMFLIYALCKCSILNFQCSMFKVKTRSFTRVFPRQYQVIQPLHGWLKPWFCLSPDFIRGYSNSTPSGWLTSVNIECSINSHIKPAILYYPLQSVYSVKSEKSLVAVFINPVYFQLLCYWFNSFHNIIKLAERIKLHIRMKTVFKICACNGEAL